MTDRFSYRLMLWQNQSLTATGWDVIADEAPPEAMACHMLALTDSAYAAELLDSFTREIKRIPKCRMSTQPMDVMADRLENAIARAAAEWQLHERAPGVGPNSAEEKRTLSLALHCVRRLIDPSQDLCGDHDFAAWAIAQAVPIAARMGHALDAPPRLPRKTF